MEPLAPEDIEILRLESPTVAGHALKMAILDPVERGPRPDSEALRARIAERIEREPRLRRKLHMGTGRRAAAAWVDDPAFDLREQVRALPVAGPVSEDGLRRIVARVMEERLERSRPLWTIDVVDPLEDGGIAVIWKIHHCLADGVTALRFAEEVLWDAPAGDLGPLAGSHEDAPASPLAEVRQALSARRPGRLPPVLRRELHRTRHSSPFEGVIGSSRIVAFASVPLDALKRAVKALVREATVNDVVLALVAGALRRSVGGGGGSLGTVRVRVPVSLHHRAESAEIANRDSFFVVSLELEEPDPVQRLRRINAETTMCKRAGDPLVMDTLLRDLRHIAPPLRRLLERLTGHPQAFALNVSNVPGPPDRPSVLGAPLRAFYSIAEIGDRHGLRVAVVSMADELHFGLCADPAIVREVDTLATGILAEASALLDEVA